MPEAAQGFQDTVNVSPGQRYDVVWEAREPGKWLLHCHINHHTTNNNVEQAGGGGLMLVIDVAAAGTVQGAVPQAASVDRGWIHRALSAAL